MYLRHEAGHAFNYAYSSTEKQNGRPFRAVPATLSRELQTGSFSRRYVRHMKDGMRRNIRMKTLPKHLRCGLRPDSKWRKRYKALGRHEETAIHASHRRDAG